jgi:anaerobic dimethyl sulfoxide reductase subunit C (anchor subunit)
MSHRGSEWQLVFFTILTQMAVGTFALWGIPALLIPTPNPFSEGQYPAVLLVLVLGLLVLGSLSAISHLGRPSHALFSVANLRSSWLSREALLGSSVCLVVLLLSVRRFSGAPYTVLDLLFILAGMIAGLTLVYGISRLYMLRTVPAWNNPGTPTAFFTTTFLLGTVANTTLWILLVSWDDAYAADDIVLSKLVLISTLLILLFSGLQVGIFIFQAIYLNSQGGVAADSIRSLWVNLRAVLIWRYVTALVGTGILVITLVFWTPPLFLLLAFGSLLVSEVLGRFLFYGFYRREGF